MGIDFVTLRKRTKSLPGAIAAAPDADRKRVRLTNVGRIYRTPRVLESTVRLARYPGVIRQIALRDLGHENPTLLLTSQMKTSAGHLIDRYARRMVIGNAIADAIDFFHMDALSAAVPMKVDLDLQLTLMANTLYRLLAVRLGKGRQVSRARTLFRDFIKATAEIRIGDNLVIVRIGRRANNPFLLNAGYGDTETTVPWLQNRTLKIEFVCSPDSRHAVQQ
ncbi:MAG: hypothetical protein OXF56_01190 [Rhodobacteraceae bacterium]|nr:hypothetical protein [Paracoccaceae bacterium]